ncbi:MAG TPA: hypothetical protein VNG33_02885 [Polyangiaceae bacterium]|nr:hypothetical protein [Polyangiaceae bacterium]
MRVLGRRIYPTTLAERRVLLSLGAYPLYVPRGVSPYLVARKIARVAQGQAADLVMLREVLAKNMRRPLVAQLAPAELVNAASTAA